MNISSTHSPGTRPRHSLTAAREDEPWPTQTVRLIAASGPGGNPDVLARLLAEKFTFGKPFIVENVPGAGGIVAANMVAKSPPDGHVLMFGDSGAMAINPALNPSLGYDPIKDFAPITALVSLPTIMSANPAAPGALADFIAPPGRARQDELWLGRPAQSTI